MDGRRSEIDDWFRQWTPDQRERAQTLADQVRVAGESAAGATLDEAIKWRRVTFTVNGDWHHWLCAIAVPKRAVSLVFHKGALLDDPAGLLQGEGRYLRQLSYDQAAADPDAVAVLIRQAIVHQTDMVDRDA